MVQLHFQEKPWDLHAALFFSVVSAAVLLVLDVGNLISVVLVFFVPGYVLIAALFPGPTLARDPVIDWIERIALSVGLSIAVAPLLGFLLNFTPWGIRFLPVVLTITIFTVGVGVVAYWRRMRLPPGQRLSATLNLSLLTWKEYSLLDKGLTIALSAGIFVAGGALAYVVLTPLPAETFSEFYILGPGGNASGYPTALNVSRNGSVIIGIANHEAATANYTVHVDLVGVRIVFNATAALNETVEVNRTSWTWLNVTVADGANWSQPYTFRISYMGLWKVQFLLFKDGDFSSPYRELHLFVHVQ